MTKSSRRTLVAALLFVPSFLLLKGAVPDSVDLPEMSNAQVIAGKLKRGNAPTLAEKNKLSAWVETNNPFLQMMGLSLVRRLPSNESDANRLMAACSRSDSEVVIGICKVAQVCHTIGHKPLKQRIGALLELTEDPNPFAAFEALRALDEIDSAAALAKARALYSNVDHPLRANLNQFLRKHGDNIPPMPVPSSLYATVVELTD